MSPIPRRRVASFAPPQTKTRGWPASPLRTSISVQAIPRLQPVPSALQDRLFRRPSAGEMLDRMLARLAVTDLAVGIHPAQEQLAVLFDHLANPRTFDNIGADSQDFHARPVSRRLTARVTRRHPRNATDQTSLMPAAP